MTVVAGLVPSSPSGSDAANWTPRADEEDVPQQRLAGEDARKPVLMLMGVVHGIVAVGLSLIFWQQQRAIDALPVAAVGDDAHAGEYRRIEGRLGHCRSTGRARRYRSGGEKFAGAVVLVGLSSGGEVLLPAGSMSVLDVAGVMDDVRDGGGDMVHTQGKVIDGFDAADLPQAARDGRVMVLLSYP